MGGTQAAGESCLIGENLVRGGLFPDTCDCCSSSVVRPTHHLGTAGVGIELGRASGRRRVTSLALSVARWVHSSAMTTFPEAPLQSRKVGFPDSGFDLGYPREVFPKL
jgi:hypothetical protein